jgi:peptidoglycan/LPS O-acetylase OafA/YrhL
MNDRSPGDAIATRDNSFDLLRLGGCATVVWSHSYALAGVADPLHTVFGFQFGTLGVFVLFGMSGYLLAASLTADARLGPFWIKRGLRLWPGLFVSVALTALVMGPLVTELSAGHYLRLSQPYTYVLKQSVFDTFHPHLPGVFLHNPLPLVVNGSLWTLPLEVCCYAAMAIGSVVGALRRPRLLAAIVGVVLIVMIVVAPPDSPVGVPPHGIKLLANALRPCGAFAFGALLWAVKDRVPRSWPLLGLALAVLLIPVSIGLRSAIDVLAVPYAAVVIGSMRPGPLAKVIAVGDVSYGAYIYGYPIQQVLVQYVGGLSPIGLLALSAPASWLAGFISWHTIERRAIGLRRKFAYSGSR